jgi:tellurite resistance-related uncharacterized protein
MTDMDTDFMDLDFMDDLLDQQTWTITNDRTADWAAEKVLWEIAERDRLLKLADDRIAELQEQKKLIAEQVENRTQFFKGKLREYFEKVKPSNVTKTRVTYNLLTGKLVLKKQQPEYVRDEAMMVAWAKDNAPQYVQTKESIAWGELKKATALVGEMVVMAETGEAVAGVKAVAREDVFEVVK